MTDHLGNTRIDFAVATDNAVASVQDYHYYPFGMDFTGLVNGASENQLKYNGKELQEDLGLEWYDYGARFYSAEIGRWHCQDPMEQFHSPYDFMGGNPVNNIDPTGMYAYSWKNKRYEHNGKKVSWEKVSENYSIGDYSIKKGNVITVYSSYMERLIKIAKHNKNWDVIPFSTLKGAASKISAYSARFGLNNLVIRSHGVGFEGAGKVHLGGDLRVGKTNSFGPNDIVDYLNGDLRKTKTKEAIKALIDIGNYISCQWQFVSYRLLRR